MILYIHVHVSGVQQRIREHCPNAPYVHCKSHNLNLVVTESCKINRQVRNLMAFIGQMTWFYVHRKKTTGNSQVLIRGEKTCLTNYLMALFLKTILTCRFWKKGDDLKLFRDSVKLDGLQESMQLHRWWPSINQFIQQCAELKSSALQMQELLQQGTYYF